MSSAINTDRKTQPGSQYLKFYLEPDTRIILPIRQITEVLKIAVGQIVPIPQMPPWVMGVYNWRGNILWMLDLGQLLGLNSWYQQSINTANYTAIVLSPDRVAGRTKALDNISLGLVVTRVEDIQWCNTDLIQSPPTSAVSPALAPFLQGYWLDRGSNMMLALDGKAIIAAMPQAQSN